MFPGAPHWRILPGWIGAWAPERFDELPAPGDRFAEYAGTGERHLRDACSWRSTATWRRSLARRYRGRGESNEDLEQVALLGLVKASTASTRAAGSLFPNFAVPTIQGELKRHFAGQWMVRVPRSLQERVMDLGRAIDELTNVSGALADDLGAGRGDGRLRRGRSSRRWRPGSPTRRWRSTRRTVDGTGDAAGRRALGREDVRLRAGRAGSARDGLLAPARGPCERLIIRLRFFDELTQTEIAAQVGHQPDAGLPLDPPFVGPSAGSRADR